MKLRAPSVPLITVDPYFSVWSSSNTLNGDTIQHWTGKPNTMDGFINVDGEQFRFMGKGKEKKIKQVSLDITALVTEYVFSDERIRLTLDFFTPVFAEELYYVSRPVSYLRAEYASLDGEKHEVSIELSVSEEICLDKKGDDRVVVGLETVSGKRECISLGSKKQKMLTRSGDDLRIEWGRFYLSGPSGTVYSVKEKDSMTFVNAYIPLKESRTVTVLFAYDDEYSLKYFGRKIKAYWHTKGINIFEAMQEAADEADKIFKKCLKYSGKIYSDALECGGEKYAELLSLAYRQVIAAHKLAVDGNGENVFISKECFSNGCAATVDVTYPSSPLMLLYNTELLKATMRPIFKFANSKIWKFDFAPHDAGRYPLVEGQVYGEIKGLKKYYLKSQMPVEECGNMLIMMANICIVDGNTEFADRYMKILKQWVVYLEKFGRDPRNQLCTDDFAGHLAHNCNLSVKAIMGIAGYSIILKMQGKEELSNEYMCKARKMANSWIRRAANGDGSFKLAFDRPDTFSMKYNMVWDKIWKTDLFGGEVYESEFKANKTRVNKFGMPLDSRKDYTKSDWLVWTAVLAPDRKEFEKFITPLWNAYNKSESRVPMTDWYDTNTAKKIGFQNRTVQGGLFIKLLEVKMK